MDRNFNPARRTAMTNDDSYYESLSNMDKAQLILGKAFDEMRETLGMGNVTIIQVMARATDELIDDLTLSSKQWLDKIKVGANSKGERQ
jgi:hypothetical protein